MLIFKLLVNPCVSYVLSDKELSSYKFEVTLVVGIKLRIGMCIIIDAWMSGKYVLCITCNIQSG